MEGFSFFFSIFCSLRCCRLDEDMSEWKVHTLTCAEGLIYLRLHILKAAYTGIILRASGVQRQGSRPAYTLTYA